MRGIERWVQRTDGDESWFARVEAEDGSTADVSRAEYEVQGIGPDFWTLRKRRASSYSALVAEGMKRVVADFTTRLAPAGFKKVGARKWARATAEGTSTISVERSGATYGAPYNASVSLRVWLTARSAGSDDVVGLRCEMVRRPDGSAYHHRFNAETLSTYDRCLADLDLFVAEFAEPWFRAHLPVR